MALFAYVNILSIQDKYKYFKKLNAKQRKSNILKTTKRGIGEASAQQQQTSVGHGIPLRIQDNVFVEHN